MSDECVTPAGREYLNRLRAERNGEPNTPPADEQMPPEPAEEESARPRRARVTLANTIVPERVIWAWVGDPFGVAANPEDAAVDPEDR